MIWVLYTEVAARLATEVPELKAVSWYSGHLEAPELNQQVPLPAAYLRFEPIRWRDQQRGIQAGDATFEVVVIDRYAGDFRHAHAAQQMALANLKLLDKVHVALHGWGGQWFHKLARVETRLDHAPLGGWIAHGIAYTTVLTDPCADLLGPKVVATPGYTVHADSDPNGPPDATVD